MKTTGLYEEALLIVTSDHGASFQPTLSFKEPTDRNLADLMRVPLFVKLPDQWDGRIDDRNVETVDVLPTVADVLGIELGAGVDGVSALDRDGPGRSGKRLFHGARRQPLPVEWPSVAWEAPLRRKLALFGQSAEPFPRPVIAPYPHLVGQRLDALRVDARSNVETILAAQGLYDTLDPQADFLPARLKSRVVTDGERPLDLAIAVNGTIRATTRTVRFPVMGRTGFWSAFVNPESLSPGQNQIEVLMVRSEGAETVLEHIDRVESTAPRSNLVLELAELAGESQLSGFYGAQWAGDRQYRCTNGRGEVVAPITPGRPPAALEVAISRGQPVYTQLRILANGCEVFDDRIPTGPWTRTLPLSDCRLSGDRVRIELLSDTSSPRDGARPFGVCVERLELLDAF